jgi:putative membrane protein
MIRTLTLTALTATLAVSIAHAQPLAPPGTVPPGNTAPGTFTPGAPAPRTFTPGAPAQGTAAQAAVNDSLFAAAAATGGLAEVSLSELGLQRATDPELKQFSQRMVAEHTRMNTELTTLAAQKQIPLPTALDYRAQFCAQSLAGLSGQDFDRCYAKAQLVAHMDSVAMFEAESQRGMDPNIKALAARALPHIKDHLKAIKPIAERFEQQKPSTEGAASEPHGR